MKNTKKKNVNFKSVLDAPGNPGTFYVWDGTGNSVEWDSSCGTQKLGMGGTCSNIFHGTDKRTISNPSIC